jgi:hypothetical protein
LLDGCRATPDFSEGLPVPAYLFPCALPKRLLPHFCAVWLILLHFSSPASAQAPVRLAEAFPPGYQYHVSARVELSGQLTLPTEPGKPAPKALAVTGSSAIEYDERVLSPPASAVGITLGEPRTLRVYRQIDFRRTVGERRDESTLRPAVRRLVILRENHREVPFSPDGPLTPGEIDLVRTDVFTPALAGLLPAQPVAPGAKWPASAAAVEELTDMDRIDSGGLECRLEETFSLSGRRVARVRFRGTVKGVNEDGPNRQELDGSFYFDLESNHLSYLTLKGVHALLDKDGRVTGRVEGQFTLTRQAHARCPDLRDEAVAGLALEPTAENTLLLYDNPELGVRFLTPRRWRVAGVRGRQITLEGPPGNGFLLTVEPPSHVPTGPAYQAEAQAFLAKEKAALARTDPPRRIQAAPQEVDRFGFDAELGGRKLRLEYFVMRQGPAGGATIAATLLPADQAAVRSEVERIARSLTVGVTRGGPPTAGKVELPVAVPAK